MRRSQVVRTWEGCFQREARKHFPEEPDQWAYDWEGSRNAWDKGGSHKVDSIELLKAKRFPWDELYQGRAKWRVLDIYRGWVGHGRGKKFWASALSSLCLVWKVDSMREAVHWGSVEGTSDAGKVIWKWENIDAEEKWGLRAEALEGDRKCAQVVKDCAGLWDDRAIERLGYEIRTILKRQLNIWTWRSSSSHQSRSEHDLGQLSVSSEWISAWLS